MSASRTDGPTQRGRVQCSLRRQARKETHHD